MRAYRSQGPVVKLDPHDKERLEQGKTLCCAVGNRYSPKAIGLTLRLQAEVQQDCLEEQGFHLEVFPPASGYDTVQRYDIFLTQERFAKLQDEQCFISRCRADRATIFYYDPAAPFKFQG